MGRKNHRGQLFAGIIDSDPGRIREKGLKTIPESPIPNRDSTIPRIHSFLAPGQKCVILEQPPPSMKPLPICFPDRASAGRQLAEKLEPYRNRHPLILALPRGGVVVGYQVALALESPLEVLVIRKIGAPGHRELAVGAIAPGGIRIFDPEALFILGISSEDLAERVKEEEMEMDRRQRLYRQGAALPDFTDRTVILIDDGMDTGLTALAAVRCARKGGAGKIILAVPVGSPETVRKLREETDAVVCLFQPDPFQAVGQWYDSFEPTPDAEVLYLLERQRRQLNARSGKEP